MLARITITAVAAMLTVAILFSLPSDAQKTNDIATNDTRSLCIGAIARAARVAGWQSHFEDGNRDTMMIHAHTMRPESINCFISIDGKMFHLLLFFEGEDMTGMLVRYEAIEFTSIISLD